MSDRYQLESASYDGEDITPLITDIEIYEHLDKPYLTGTFSFLDNSGVLGRIRPTGTEEFTLTVKVPEARTRSISKTFIADYLIDVTKQNDNQQLVTFHIIETIGFDTISKNVNRSYKGYGRQIIEKIIQEFHGDYKLSFPIDPHEEKFNVKLIVPNMTPLEACQWIRNRTNTTDGLPFYFFSSFSLDKTLHFVSLKRLMEATSIHENTEYVYAQPATAAVMREDPEKGPFIIQAYSEENSRDTSKLIHEGLISSEYRWWDPLLSKSDFYSWNIQSAAKRVPGVDGKVDPGTKGQTKYTLVQSTKTYTDFDSYRERHSSSEYRKLSDSKGVRGLIPEGYINIAVPGKTFLDSRYNKTIGNKINIRFLDSTITPPGETPSLSNTTDPEKSGKFLIYAVRHNFRIEKYDVNLSCVKLGDLPT